jgi:hypothetical protein
VIAQSLELEVVEPRLAVCRLGVAEPIPGWVVRGAYFSVTRTFEELSVACPDNLVPEDVLAERGWRALSVAGVIEFSVSGVLARLAVPLAEAGISVFAVPTYNPDHLPAGGFDSDRWIDLDEALTRFAAIDPTAAELAKLRVIGGLSVVEAGEAFGVPRAIAFRTWT